MIKHVAVLVVLISATAFTFEKQVFGTCKATHDNAEDYSNPCKCPSGGACHPSIGTSYLQVTAVTDCNTTNCIATIKAKWGCTTENKRAKLEMKCASAPGWTQLQAPGNSWTWGPGNLSCPCSESFWEVRMVIVDQCGSGSTTCFLGDVLRKVTIHCGACTP